MSEANTQEIVAPESQAKVVIKNSLTGGDEEYIEGSLYDSMEVTADIKDPTRPVPKVKKVDMEKLAFGEMHRLIETYVVSINGESENVLELARGLPSKDYDFIKAEIATRQKKKLESVK